MERPAVAGKRVGTATPSPQERFALLRAKLQDLRYHQPLGLDPAQAPAHKIEFRIGIEFADCRTVGTFYVVRFDLKVGQ